MKNNSAPCDVCGRPTYCICSSCVARRKPKKQNNNDDTEQPKTSCQEKLDKVNGIWQRKLDRALYSQLKEVLGIIESKRKDNPEEDCWLNWEARDFIHNGYNQALDDLKAELERLK